MPGPATASAQPTAHHEQLGLAVSGRQDEGVGAGRDGQVDAGQCGARAAQPEPQRLVALAVVAVHLQEGRARRQGVPGMPCWKAAV